MEIDTTSLKEFVLPNELCDKVFEFSQLEDVKSACLVSKLWGEEKLGYNRSYMEGLYPSKYAPQDFLAWWLWQQQP
ncbi:hypothetical protein B7494_g6466 [Chlorociboria aeruginascens]|nr:hypothetical protein B7494_g6466 [Chlorociboria aeruginascens]